MATFLCTRQRGGGRRQLGFAVHVLWIAGRSAVGERVASVVHCRLLCAENFMHFPTAASSGCNAGCGFTFHYYIHHEHCHNTDLICVACLPYFVPHTETLDMQVALTSKATCWRSIVHPPPLTTLYVIPRTSLHTSG